MTDARVRPTDRLAIGQLLVKLLHAFRAELFAPAAEAGYADLREPHLHIFGNVGVDGVRLTELAERAQLSAATTSDLVSDLERLGYMERRPDPTDRRAKLIFPTKLGRRALHDARNRVAAIEQHWSELVGQDRFNAACQSLQDILDALGRDSNDSGASVVGPVEPAPHQEASPQDGNTAFRKSQTDSDA